MIKPVKTGLFLTLLLLLLTIPFTVCAERTVNVGLYDFKPLIFKNQQNVPVGLFIDVLNHVAQKEGWRINYVYGTWKDIYQGLLDGKLDLVPCIGISDARKKQVDFSNDYLFLDWGVIYSRPGSGIENILDLKNKRIAVLSGSVYTEGLKQIVQQFEIAPNFIEKNNYSDVFSAIEQLQVDAGISTSLTGIQFEKEFSARRTPIIFSPVKLAYAVKKEMNNDLLQALNREVVALKADQNSLYYDRYDYWITRLHKGKIPEYVWWSIAGLIATGMFLIFWTIVLKRQVNAKTEYLELEIVKRKQKEVQLRKSEERLQLAIRATNIGIWDWDVVKNELNWDSSMYNLYGIHEEDFVGALEAWTRTLHPEDCRHVEAEIQAAFGGEREYAPEFRIVRPDGMVRVIKAASQTFHDENGKPVRMVGTNWDITKDKEYEKELLKKNAELERFSYTVSHDLKSPLITIRSFSGAIKHDLAMGRPDRVVEDLARIEAASGKMAELLNGLLELSRIGHMIHTPEPVAMSELVTDVLESLAGLIQEHGVQVTVQPDLPTVLCDRQRMFEVIQNLLENAIKYRGDQNNPHIQFGLIREEGNNIFFVQDNGLGIDPKYHENIFGLFNKLDARSDGSGIGLALVKRIIEVHGGRVWVESQGSESGTKFCFTLAGKDYPT